MKDVTVPGGALVLVGDGRKALFLRNKGTPLHIKFVTERVLEQDNPPTREQGTDRPGRKPGSDGTSRSAIEETDWHQLAEDRFAEEIAEALYRKAHVHAFEQLVIVAPPKVLGNLRASLHEEVTARLVAEVPKDLTGHPLPEIARHLTQSEDGR
jgi:protein required for attachment to host cells